MAATALSRRETIVYQAKLAEQAERYDEMAEFMTNLVRSVSEPLSIEERNLLSVAFKNAVGARRAALRIVSSLEGKQRQRNQTEFVEITQQYHARVNEELAKICKDIIDLLNNHLLKAVDNDVEAQVFYYKMMGDYYRYLCEFCGDQKSEWTDKAYKAYEQATEVASAELGPTHPVRLGLALNYSVFHYEILGRQENACKIAKTALDEAIAELSALDEISYRDSTLIMQLLRDNLTLWTTEPDAAATSGAANAPSGAAGAPAAEEKEEA